MVLFSKSLEPLASMWKPTEEKLKTTIDNYDPYGDFRRSERIEYEGNRSYQLCE
jgi:hypothetical protein